MPSFLHVSSYAPPHGGAARVMAEQVEAQRRYFNDQVSVVSFEPGFSSLKQTGARVTQLRGYAVGQDWLLRLGEYGTLWRLVGTVDTVILHSPYYAINCTAAVIARLRRKHVVCVHHGHLPSEIRNRLNIAFMNRMIAGWLILDPAHRDYLAGYVRHLKPTHLIQNGVWIDRLKQYVQKKTGNPMRHVVYCGRVVPDKGMKELAAAVKHYPAVHFTIVGDGEDTPLFTTFPNVTLTGFVPHERALEIIATADCLILPSYHETFPMVIVEALAMRVPVIVSDLGTSIRQLVAGNGILIAPQSDKSLIAGIQSAIDQKIRVTQTSKIDALDWSRVIRPIRAACIGTPV